MVKEQALTVDRHELDNRYGDAAYSEIIADLKVQLIALRSELKEDDADYPEIQEIIDENWEL